jgi:hypothetical protein
MTVVKIVAMIGTKNIMNRGFIALVNFRHDPTQSHWSWQANDWRDITALANIRGFDRSTLREETVDCKIVSDFV